MSATNRGAERKPLDAYYTDDVDARDCVAALHFAPGSRVLEPHCGGGAFVRALLDAPNVRIVDANDVNADVCNSFVLPGRVNHTFREDFTTFRTGWACWDWIVGNPPFSDAERHIRHALTLAPNVAFLLRLAMLESERRRQFWIDHPLADLFVFGRRPSFMGGKTDSAAYGFFVWRAGHSGPFRGHALKQSPRPGATP